MPKVKVANSKFDSLVLNIRNLIPVALFAELVRHKLPYASKETIGHR